MKKTIIPGSKLAYDITTQAWYKKKLVSLVKKMRQQFNNEMIKLFRSQTAEEFRESFAMDESLVSQSRMLLNFLEKKYVNLFTKKSKIYAQQMLKKELRASNLGVQRNIKKMTGNQQFVLRGSAVPFGIKEVVKASLAENLELIKSIPTQFSEKTKTAIMRNLMAGGDIQKLKKILLKNGASSEKRARLIAEDQTRKAYNNINAERLKSLNVGKFIWRHSFGGHKPRLQHISWSGEIFSFDNLPIDKDLNVPVLPGDAPYCRCTMEPVIDFGDED